MPDLVVIVPSRGRPEAIVDLERVFRETCTADTRLMVSCDDDDPTVPPSLPERVLRHRGPHRNMVEALNAAAAELLAGAHAPFAVGFMGDDHRPRTVGWDRAYVGELRRLGSGIVYGNDLLQAEQLPTQCAMTSDIVRALGWMAPPTLQHMYVDNFWLTLGRELGRIRYLPDVVVEHLHPHAGKASWDEGYHRVNAPAVYSHDEAVFTAYVNYMLADHVVKVRAALQSVPA